MTKMDFINTICRPHITVGFDLFRFYDDDKVTITQEKFLLEQVGDWRVPWYTDVNGTGSEYNLPGAVPIKIKETLKKLDDHYKSHQEHRSSIAHFTTLINKEEQLVYDPIMPVVGYDADKNYIIFDGNHRLAASYFINKPKEITVLLVTSDNMKSISHDLKYHP
ncbi:MAG: hypothetical protein QM737_19420 [Ferruginibacter sp.]